MGNYFLEKKSFYELFFFKDKNKNVNYYSCLRFVKSLYVLRIISFTFSKKFFLIIMYVILNFYCLINHYIYKKGKEIAKFE